MNDRRLSNNQPVYAQFTKIKRKRFWVIRWVEIIDGTLSYKGKQIDKQNRGIYILADCSIQERMDNDGKMIVVQQLIGDKEKVNLMAENNQEHQILVDLLIQFSKQPMRYQKSTALTKSINQETTMSFQGENSVIQINHFKLDQHKIIGSCQTQRQQDERMISRFIPDENLLKNNLTNGSLMRLKSNYQKMVGEFQEEIKIMIESSKDMESFVLRKKDEKHKKEKDTDEQPIKSMSIAQRIQQTFSYETEHLGIPLVITIGMIFFLMISLFIYLLLMLVDNSVFFYSSLITINLILLPLISSQFKHSKGDNLSFIKSQYQGNKTYSRIMCCANIHLDVNEFVFLVRNHELRKSWSPYISQIQYKDFCQYKIAYYIDSNNIFEEQFSQNVFREDNSVIIVEHFNLNIIRIFQAIWLPQYDDEERTMILKYYSKVTDDVPSQNGQAAIKGIQQMIKKMRSNPQSPLFEYIQRQVQQTQTESRRPSKFLESEEELKQQIQPTLVGKNSETKESLEVEEEQKQVVVSQVSTEMLKYIKVAQDVKVYLETQSLLIPENNWQLKDNSNGFQVHTKLDIKSGNMLSRGEGIIPYPIEDFYEIISMVERRGDYDQLFDMGYLIKEMEDDYRIIYQKFKSMIIVSARDFVLLTKRFINADKSWTITASSIDYLEVGEKKGIVRGNIDYGGWILTPLENNTKTKAIFVVLVDPKGSIPSKIVAQTSKIQGQCVEKIKNLMDKQKIKK